MLKEVKQLASDLKLEISIDLEKLTCIIGKSTKKAKNGFKRLYAYRFRSESQLYSHALDWLKFRKVWQEKESELKKQRELENIEKAKNVKIGDVFACSWGYDQTNVDFYQVVKRSPKTVTLREIEKTQTGETGFMSGEVKPVLNAFIGDPIRRKLIGDEVFIKSFMHAYKTDPNEWHAISWYA